ncbi:hypothetical protein GUITHDRAFT_108292 [Guillardia theta CCMP2712]|uniref:UvrC family homology region profile domain-containing protein n=1 Tax=Guillardia theta (strain CCMP2712) TaxID=905079 RepID=L1JCL2_GUITC|nr:hypothetical protein GUITHDRAFT_108292 [Guillardia theta CCMP2712]EKX45844.1 hypothetical protein GUITHDRAFT_108292 [Guillardia theta CCMP2712]|eukprot:XP_005832824.1 hypothetical protein GUITHDRAFT_108292 [Guillardia theta CCMP2712]
MNFFTAQYLISRCTGKALKPKAFAAKCRRRHAASSAVQKKRIFYVHDLNPGVSLPVKKEVEGRFINFAWSQPSPHLMVERRKSELVVPGAEVAEHLSCSSLPLRFPLLSGNCFFPRLQSSAPKSDWLKVDRLYGPFASRSFANKICIRKLDGPACSYGIALKNETRRGGRGLRASEEAMAVAEAILRNQAGGEEGGWQRAEVCLIATIIDGLAELSATLKMEKTPRIIEGYDISHIQGYGTIASSSMLLDGFPVPRYYRWIRIESANVRTGHSDDFASLAEAIIRRYSSIPSSPLPDVVLIDGGRGQLAAVMAAIRNSTDPGRCEEILKRVTFLSLAKQREEVYVPDNPRPLHFEGGIFSAAMLLLRQVYACPTTGVAPHDWPPLRTCTAIAVVFTMSSNLVSTALGVHLATSLFLKCRDEAHAFAVYHHRSLRSSEYLRSVFDAIPGIERKTRKKLIEKFGSIEALGTAEEGDIAAVEVKGEGGAEETRSGGDEERRRRGDEETRRRGREELRGMMKMKVRKTEGTVTDRWVKEGGRSCVVLDVEGSALVLTWQPCQGVDELQASAIIEHFQKRNLSEVNGTSLSSNVTSERDQPVKMLQHVDSFQKIFRRAERKWRR